MAFTPEDGSQVVGANAYLTVAAFKVHHDDRGRAYTAFTDTQIEQAIVKGTDYIDKRFGRRFRGEKASTTQGLEWPRVNAIDDAGRLMTELPDELTKAAAEYAYLSLTLGTELAPVGSPVAGKITEEKVGPISTKYSDRSSPMVSTGNMIQNLPEYPEADLWIEALLKSDMSRRLVRG